VASGRCAEHSSVTLRFAAALAMLGACSIVTAQEGESPRQRGQFSVSFQRSVAQDLHTSDFTIGTNPITAQVLDFSVDWALNDRWMLTAGLPWIEKKAWVPGRSHDPLLVTPPHPESDYVDDGQYHGYLQDLSLGATYLALGEPVVVEPYIALTTPASDYPFFAVAAVGQHLRRQEIGSAISYRPPFLRWFFTLRAGYVFAPETLGVNVDATRVDGEAVFFVNPKVSIRTFFSSKNGKGMAPPRRSTDVPSEVWYQHDRMIRHNYATVGLGADWALSRRNVIGVSFIEMVHAEDIFELKHAFDIRVARSFGPAANASKPNRPSRRAGTAVDD